MGTLTNPIHLIFIATVALIFLGPKRLPDLAKSIGHSVREFRSTLSLEGRDDTSPAAAPMAVAPVPLAPPAPEHPLPPVPPVVPAAAAPSAPRPSEPAA